MNPYECVLARRPQSVDHAIRAGYLLNAVAAAESNRRMAREIFPGIDADALVRWGLYRL